MFTSKKKLIIERNLLLHVSLEARGPFLKIELLEFINQNNFVLYVFTKSLLVKRIIMERNSTLQASLEARWSNF